MKTKSENNTAQRKLSLPGLLLFFLATWIFLGWYYADVLNIAQQYSFFTLDGLLMKFVTDKPYGYLWWLGRGLLQLFHYPVLGAALFSLLLTVIAALTAYVYRIPSNWRVLQYLIPLGWLGYMVYAGYDLYYQQETGKILGIPACILIILLIQAIFVRTFRKRSYMKQILTDSDLLPRSYYMQSGFLILGFSLLIGFNERYRPYVRPTVYLQRCMWAQRWDEMIDYVRDISVSARPVAAYYAIALSQKGQINDGLFDIKYDYADLHIHNRTGSKDIGTAMYEMDGNFYAGLLLPANRCAVEKMTMDGPSVYLLKRMIQIALLTEEQALCEKYLTILEKLPFEQDFVKKYRDMNRNQQLLLADEELSRIKLLEPVRDYFEYSFRQPTFLGYNVAMLEGRSQDALFHSIAACLYSKMMPAFLLRTQPLIGTTPTGSVADAIVLENSKNPDIAQYFPIDDFARRKFQIFMQESAHYTKNREVGREKLFERYRGYYPYYYYYGNLPSKANKPQNKTIQNKSGVN